MSSEGFLSLVAEGKLESSESIRENLSPCACVFCAFIVSVFACITAAYYCGDKEMDRRDARMLSISTKWKASAESEGFSLAMCVFAGFDTN